MTAFRILTTGIAMTLLSFGAIRGTMSLRNTLEQADLVVVATVSQVVSSANQPSINLAVKRTIKGTDVDGQTIQSSWTGGTPGINGQPFQLQPTSLLRRSGIFFLKQSASEWTILPLATGSVSEEDLYLPAAALLTSGNQYASALTSDDKLQVEIQAASQDPSSAQRLLGMFDRGELDSLGVGILSPLLQTTTLVKAADTAGAYSGFAGQLRNSIPSAVISLSKSTLATAATSSQMLVASALCDYRNLDSVGIAALASLTASQNSTNIRSCATHALREIHSSTTLPTLKALLDDPSSWRIRYDAMVGIAQYAMKFPVVNWSEKHQTMATFQPASDVTTEMRANFPAMDVFEKGEQQYITFWKAWLTNNSASLAPLQ